MTLTQVLTSRDRAVAKLNEWPMIFAHDAGTGYLEDKTSLRDDSVTAHFEAAAAKTQSGSLVDQAKCGARAFDIRPYLRANGKLVFHHGDAVVNYSLTKALEELVEWNMEHPEELIILSYSHYAAESGNNQDAATALGDVFAHLGIKLGHMGNLVHVDATAGTSESVTVAEAQEISGPGIPLAVATTEITNTYYDLGGDVMGQCYRFMSIDEFIDFDELLLDEVAGWVASDNALDVNLSFVYDVVKVVTDAVGGLDVGTSCYSYPGSLTAREEMRELWDSVAVPGPEQNLATYSQPLWKVDGHWHYSTESIVMMFLSGSTNEYDIRRSNQNYQVAKWIEQGALPMGGNMIAMDYVCIEGSEVYEAIQVTLFEREDVFEKMGNYFSGALAGVMAGEEEYTIPMGGFVLVLVLVCCCCWRRCTQQSMSDEWEEDEDERHQRSIMKKEASRRDGYDMDDHRPGSVELS